MRTGILLMDIYNRPQERVEYISESNWASNFKLGLVQSGFKVDLELSCFVQREVLFSINVISYKLENKKFAMSILL